VTIQKRIVTSKRHTAGYVINGAEYTRAQTIKLARKGEIDGVRVAKGPAGAYLVSSVSSRSLYSLPITVQIKSRRRPRARAAAKTTK
jgi:glyoxylate carboligase